MPALLAACCPANQSRNRGRGLAAPGGMANVSNWVGMMPAGLTQARASRDGVSALDVAFSIEREFRHGLNATSETIRTGINTIASKPISVDRALVVFLFTCLCACAYTRTCRKIIASRKARIAREYAELDEEAGAQNGPGAKHSPAKKSQPRRHVDTDGGGSKYDLALLMQLSNPPDDPDDDAGEDEVAAKPSVKISTQVASNLGRNWEPIKAKVILSGTANENEPVAPMRRRSASPGRRQTARVVKLPPTSVPRVGTARLLNPDEDAWQEVADRFNAVPEELTPLTEADVSAIQRLRATMEASAEEHAHRLAFSAPSPPPPPAALPPPAPNGNVPPMAKVAAAPVEHVPSAVARDAVHDEKVAPIAQAAIAPTTAEDAMQALQSLQGMGPIEAMATLDSIKDEAVQALQEQAREALYATAALGSQVPSSTPPKRKASKRAASTPPRRTGGASLKADAENSGAPAKAATRRPSSPKPAGFSPQSIEGAVAKASAPVREKSGKRRNKQPVSPKPPKRT